MTGARRFVPPVRRQLSKRPVSKREPIDAVAVAKAEPAKDGQDDGFAQSGPTLLRRTANSRHYLDDHNRLGK